MLGYIFAHTSVGLLKALEEGASVLIGKKNLLGKPGEIYLHMSNMWRLKNQLLLRLNISYPIKNVHCWVFWQLWGNSHLMFPGVLRIPLTLSDWLRPPSLCKMLFKFSCCHWLLLVNGLVTGVCSDYLNQSAVCSIMEYLGYFKTSYLGSCLSSSLSFFFHQGRIPKCAARQVYCWWGALWSQVPQECATTVLAQILLCLQSSETSMEYFGEHWHKEVDYVLFPTLCMLFVI